MNHINFLDAPLLYTFLLPRPVFGLAKIEAWDNPFQRFLGNLWDAIPLNRGEADVGALREATKRLEEGQILVLAPEGTRSGHGRLLKGLAGVAFLALRTGAPLLPVAHYGGEVFWSNLKRLRRTDFHIVVGQPFELDTRGVRVTGEVRQQMTDEIMYQIAALLPVQYRGVYSDLGAATEEYIRFPRGALSNLQGPLT
jgi:1-acyl-sn-glycerol-3-phosphate acyltransferase